MSDHTPKIIKMAIGGIIMAAILFALLVGHSFTGMPVLKDLAIGWAILFVMAVGWGLYTLKKDAKS